MTPRMARFRLAIAAAMLVLGHLPGAAAQDATPVRIVAPLPMNGGTPLRFTGSLTAARQADLSPRVSGLVKQVEVDAGDAAEEGDVLVELDATMAELERQRASAVLAEARKRLEEAERVRDEAYALGQNIPQTTLRAREAQVEIESAVVARLQAELRQQVESVTRHKVLAPFDGVVTRKLTEVGEWVQTGTPVLTFVATDRLRLDVQVPQEYFGIIALDSPVRVRLDAEPSEPLAGRVAATVPLSDTDARTFLVRVTLETSDRPLIAGMSGEAAFSLPGDRKALELPRDAVLRHPDGSTTVWVVEQGDAGAVARERTVTLGRTLSETVEVISGLEPDTSVVVRGNELLRDGQQVRPVEDRTEGAVGGTSG